MKNRPWWLVLAAVLHILEPFFKIIFFSIVQKMTPLAFVQSQINPDNPMYTFTFFLLFPIMGIAMFSLNKWVFVLLILSEAWVLLSNLVQLPGFIEKGQTDQIISVAIFTLVNLTIIYILILPIFRLALTDQRIQWWRTYPRYRFRQKVKINDLDGEIRSISESGIFLSVVGIKINEKVSMQFNYDGVDYSLNGLARSYIVKKGVQGVGIEFENNDRENSQKLGALIKGLKAKGASRSSAKKTVAPGIGGGAGENSADPDEPQTEENTLISYKINDK